MKIMIIAPTFFPKNDVGIFRMTTLADFLLGKDEIVAVMRSNDSPGISEANMPYKFLSKVEEIRVSDENRYFKSCETYKKAILQYCSNHNVDLFLYTCAPYYAMKIAPEIKKSTGKPYAIDIRDFWLKNDEESLLTVWTQNIIYPIKWVIQKRAFCNAAKIIVVSESMKMRYMKLYKKYENKFEVVYNGFDDQRLYKEDIETKKTIKEIEQINCIKIGFCGVLCQYSRNYAAELLKALNTINNSYKKIKIFHMGKPEPAVEEVLSENNIDKEIYQYLGYLPNEKCMEILLRMDFNAIVGLRKQGLGTKVFDYMIAKKPIIYVGVKNAELAEFLTASENSAICSREEDVVKFIKNFNYLKTFKEYNISIYKRSIQNLNYYKILEGIIDEKKQL